MQKPTGVLTQEKKSAEQAQVEEAVFKKERPTTKGKNKVEFEELDKKLEEILNKQKVQSEKFKVMEFRSAEQFINHSDFVGIQ